MPISLLLLSIHIINNHNQFLLLTIVLNPNDGDDGDYNTIEYGFGPLQQLNVIFMRQFAMHYYDYI